MLLAFHKPYGVLSQFTAEVPGQRTLAGFGFPKDVYPVGRLDQDSEGLLLLSDEKSLVDRLLNPRHAHPRVYFVQVEGSITAEAVGILSRGVVVQGKRTLPCRGAIVSAPPLPPRDPPIRHRTSIPTSWLSLELHEGRNRQVRRMTAAAGFPTLRLVRMAIGGYSLGALPPGQWITLSPADRERVLASCR